MATKQQVLDLHATHPDWTSGQIAQVIGCDPAYVRATRSRNGLKVVRSSERRDTSVYDLGLACRAAGLTLRDILDISEKRKKTA